MILEKLKSIWEKIEYRMHTEPVRFCFYSITLTGLILLTVASVVTKGAALSGILFDDRTDYFMDYFNSIYYSLNGPYQNFNVIYPALVTLAYEAVGIILGWLSGPFSNGFEIRESPYGILSYAMVSALGIAVLCFAMKKSKTVSRKEALVFCGIMLTSFPLLFCIDRGNSMLFAVAFTALFLALYDEDDKKYRYLAYVSLGIATAIKMYPGIFGILILRRALEERDYKELILCVIICAVMLLLPFLWTDGTFADMLKNATGYGAGNVDIIQVNVIYMVNYFLKFTDLSEHTRYTVSSAVSYMLLLVILISVLFDKKMPTWQAVCLLAGSQVLCAGLGMGYLLLFMVIPAWYFLNSPYEETFMNTVYSVIFAFILLIIPGTPEKFEMYASFSLFKGLCTLLIVAILLVYSYDRLLRAYRERTPSRTAASAEQK